MKRQKMFYSNLECTECGNKLVIPRKKAKRREEGHIKHMFCPICATTTAHIEDNRTKQEIEWDKIQEELLAKRGIQNA